MAFHKSSFSYIPHGIILKVVPFQKSLICACVRYSELARFRLSANYSPNHSVILFGNTNRRDTGAQSGMVRQP